MKRLLLLVMVVAATWGGLSWGDATAQGASPVTPQHYQPQKVTKFKLKGDGASALFSTPGACDQHFAQVGASHDATKEGAGKAESATTMFLNLFFYKDSCDQPISTSSTFTITPELFTIGDEMGSATLNTVVEVCCDNFLLPFSVSINLTWKAIGPLTKGKNIITSKSPGCKMSYNYHGEWREAVATGSITVFEQELASQPSVIGVIDSVKVGEMTIGCE